MEIDTYTFRASGDLLEAIRQAAEAEGLPMNEWLAQTAARRLDRSELGRIPRRPVGRRRKPLVPDAADGPKQGPRRKRLANAS